MGKSVQSGGYIVLKMCAVLAVLVFLSCSASAIVYLTDVVPTTHSWKRIPLSYNETTGEVVYAAGLDRFVDYTWAEINSTAWGVDISLNPAVKGNISYCRSLGLVAKLRCFGDLRTSLNLTGDYVGVDDFVSDASAFLTYPVMLTNGQVKDRVRNGSFDLVTSAKQYNVIELGKWRNGVELKGGTHTQRWASATECTINLTNSVSVNGENVIADCNLNIEGNLSLSNLTLTMNSTTTPTYSINVNRTGIWKTENVYINVSNAALRWYSGTGSVIRTYGMGSHTNLTTTKDTGSGAYFTFEHWSGSDTKYYDLHIGGIYQDFSLYGNSTVNLTTTRMTNACDGYMNPIKVTQNSRLSLFNTSLCASSGTAYLFLPTYTGTGAYDCANCSIISYNYKNLSSSVSYMDWRIYQSGGASVDGYFSLTTYPNIMTSTAGTQLGRGFPMCAYSNTANTTSIGSGHVFKATYSSTSWNLTSDGKGCVWFMIPTNKSLYDASTPVSISVDGTFVRNVGMKANTNDKDGNGNLVGVVLSNVNATSSYSNLQATSCWASSSNVLQGTPLIVNVTVAKGTPDLDKAFFYANGALQNITAAANGQNLIAWFNTGSLLGTYTLNCTANETNGNKSSSTNYPTVNFYTTTTTTLSPTTTIRPRFTSFTANQSNVMQGGAVSFSAGIQNGSNALDRWWIARNGSTWWLGQATIGANGHVLTTEGLQGNYSVLAYVNDTASNVNVSGQLWVNVYTTTTSTTSTTTTTGTTVSTTMTIPLGNDSIIRSNNGGIQVYPSNRRIYFDLFNLTMLSPDGSYSCCGPNNNDQWGCTSGMC